VNHANLHGVGLFLSQHWRRRGTCLQFVTNVVGAGTQGAIKNKNKE